MRSEVEELSPVEVQVRVEVPWDRVKKDLDASYREVAKHAKVKGFRPGKVPAGVLRKLYGKRVRSEVAANLVEEGVMNAVQEHHLHIVAQPQVDEAPDVADGEDLVFKARMEVRPHVGEVEVDGLAVWQRPADIPNADVDQEVERLRKEHADVQVPEPARPAQSGDRVIIDYRLSVDGEDQPEAAATDRPADLGEEGLLPEIEAALVGASPGDEKTCEVHFGDDHGNPALRGKTGVFSVTVKEVQERLLPDVDDEFAKDVGDFETLLELRLDIRKRLEDKRKARIDAEMREQVIDRLVEKNPVPLPPSLVRQQEQQMLQEMFNLARMMGQMPDGSMLEGLHERAERRVRAGMLLGALARQAKLEVTDGEIDGKIKEIADRTGKHVAKVKADFAGERRGELESELLEGKLMDYLLARATIREGEPPERPSPASSAEAAGDGDDDTSPEAEGTALAGPADGKESAGGAADEEKTKDDGSAGAES